MKYLLDTNVISELTRPRPSPVVAASLAALEEEDVFLSTITIAELRRGIAMMPPGRRRTELDGWVRDELLPRFETRIVPVDLGTAEAWGAVMAESRTSGANMTILDAFIAATALSRGLVLLTRNTRHFTWCGVEILDPWAAK